MNLKQICIWIIAQNIVRVTTVRKSKQRAESKFVWLHIVVWSIVLLSSELILSSNAYYKYNE